MKNSVTVYSNGIAAFNRQYEVTKDTKISIPFRKAYIADVLQTLNIYGNVTLKEPPNFEPENSEKTSVKINTSDATFQLVAQLSGSLVKITQHGSTESLEGKLLGNNLWEEDKGEYTVQHRQVSLYTERGLKTIDYARIANIEFTELGIREEITKALSVQQQLIKPKSTFVDFQLVSADGNKQIATIQYAIPTAAWASSYRLIQKNDGKIQLTSYAVVHNTTDEDWKEFVVSVVTGEPLTFSTDLAEQKTPGRNRVNIVKSQAQGGFENEEGIDLKSLIAPAAGSGSRKMSKAMKSAVAAGPFQALELHDTGPLVRNIQAETAEVGDFSIFTSASNLDIPANRSVDIPLSDVDLEDARIILSYNERFDSRRPFRAIKFKNSTKHSLARGACAVYNKDLFEGSAVLPACKQDEYNTLMYAKETGVKVAKVTDPTKEVTVGVVAKGGVGRIDVRYLSTTTYTVVNTKAEHFSLELDHIQVLPSSEMSITGAVINEKTESGIRAKCELLSKHNLTISVVESSKEHTEVSISTNWLKNAIGIANMPQNDPRLKECFALIEKINDLEEDNNRLSAEYTTLDQQSVRLRSNIQAVTQSPEAAGEWIKQLSVNEKRIAEIYDKKTRNKDEEGKQSKLLQGLFSNLTFDWHNRE
jgi:hypothetical protein